MQRDLSFRESFTYDSEFIKFKGGELKCDFANLLSCRHYFML